MYTINCNMVCFCMLKNSKCCTHQYGSQIISGRLKLNSLVVNSWTVVQSCLFVGNGLCSFFGKFILDYVTASYMRCCFRSIWNWSICWSFLGAWYHILQNIGIGSVFCKHLIVFLVALLSLLTFLYEWKVQNVSLQEMYFNSRTCRFFKKESRRDFQKIILKISTLLQKCTRYPKQGRSVGGTMPRAPNHWRAPKCPTMSQSVLPTVRYIYYQKTLGWKTGALNLFLAPGAI